MKTALVLSGGGAKGAYEIGVYQALLDMNIKVDILVGTSIGAMNSYIIAQHRFAEAKKLWETIKTKDVFDFSEAIERTKTVTEEYAKDHDMDKLKTQMRTYVKEQIGDNTGARFTNIKKLLDERFSEDAVRASDIEFGICTVRIPNEAYISDIGDLLKKGRFPDKDDLKRLKPEAMRLWKEDIPKGRMLDYVLASCSIFPITVPYEIDGQYYIDGGYADNMPISMALEKGADVIIAVRLEAPGLLRFGDMVKADWQSKLITIFPSESTGDITAFDPVKSKRLMHMGYMDTLRIFKKLKLD